MFINILCCFGVFAFALSVFDFEIPQPLFVLILTGQARARKIPQKITQAQVLLVLRLQKLNYLILRFRRTFCEVPRRQVRILRCGIRFQKRI